MQAEIKKNFGVDATLIGGHGGAFEVTVDGDVIFDKFMTGRFPEEQEIIEKIQQIKK